MTLLLTEGTHLLTEQDTSFVSEEIQLSTAPAEQQTAWFKTVAEELIGENGLTLTSIRQPGKQTLMLFQHDRRHVALAVQDRSASELFDLCEYMQGQGVTVGQLNAALFALGIGSSNERPLDRLYSTAQACLLLAIDAKLRADAVPEDDMVT